MTLQASVGIATGLVVVGEQLGTGDTRQRVAIGETPNLAARLQAAAAPGEVVIAASTQRLVGRMFDCRALGCHRGEGAAAAGGGVAGAWRDGRRQPLRGAARGRRCPRSSAGRRRSSCCCAVGIRPRPARVGSCCSPASPASASRALPRACWRRLEGEPHARLRYFCSPHHTHSPLYPFIAQIEQAAGFEPGSSASAKLDKLEALLKPTATNLPRDRGAHRRAGGGAGGRALPGVGGQPAAEARDDPHRASRPARRRSGARTRPDRGRGRPLDRSDIAGFARSNGCPRRQPAGAAGRHVPAGVPAELGRSAACDDAALEPPWPSRQRRHHWRHRQGQGAARRRRRADPRARRWRAAVHRGADEHAARERAVA